MMKKILWPIVIVTILICCFFCYTYGDPEIGETEIRNIEQYLQVNKYTESKLKTCFVGALPSEEMINKEQAQYYYYYKCGLFGEPGFVIWLKEPYTDKQQFAQKVQWAADNAVYSKKIDAQKKIYLLSPGIKQLEEYVNEDSILDGMAFTFEILLIDEENPTIEYLFAIQQDNATKPEKIEQYLAYLELTNEIS